MLSLSAVVPVFLAGALPPDEDAARHAVRATIAAVGTAIAGLPPAAQHELAQLFALLGFAPARLTLARVTPGWREAPSRRGRRVSYPMARQPIS